MRITNCLNTTIEDVKAKKFNIFIGISLGNKYFVNKYNTREFISWALENSKHDVVVLIPDKIHLVNYEVRNGYSREKAYRAVLRKSEETERLIEEIIITLSEVEKNRVAILT